MRIIFKFKDFQEWVNQSDTLKRKLIPKIYTAVVTPRGIELLPVMATKHLHVILVEISDEKEYEKMIEFLRNQGFENIPFGIVEPITG